jgi:hypothetical protein
MPQCVQKNVGRLLAVFACLVAAWIALSFVRVVAHDVVLYRSETDGSTACFKAMVSGAMNRMRVWNRVELVQSSDERFQPKASELGDGNYSVLLWYDCTAGPRAPARIPVRCTMHCGGVDDWELIDVKIADEPLVGCHESLSPTGMTNELWIYSWLDRTLRTLTERLRLTR